MVTGQLVLDATNTPAGTLRQSATLPTAVAAQDGEYATSFLCSIQQLSIQSAIIKLRVQTGTIAEKQGILSSRAQLGLVHYYNRSGEDRVQHPLKHGVDMALPPITSSAQFYNYRLLEGWRISALSRTLSHTAGSALVKIDWQGTVFAGEVLSIFHHAQSFRSHLPGDSELMAEVRWMCRSEYCTANDDIWIELCAQYFVFDLYLY